MPYISARVAMLIMIMDLMDNIPHIKTVIAEGSNSPCDHEIFAYTVLKFRWYCGRAKQFGFLPLQ